MMREEEMALVIEVTEEFLVLRRWAMRRSSEYRELVVAWRYWRLVLRALLRHRPMRQAGSILAAALICVVSCSS
jgi:hypothetical protein